MCALERRNVLSLSTILRGAIADTFDGFDEQGIAKSPTFSRSIQLVDGLPEPSGEAKLHWMAEFDPVVGVPHPGAVWLTEGGTARLAAANVPMNGFSVERDGKRLIVRLTTYLPGPSAADVVVRNTSIAILPRN